MRDLGFLVLFLYSIVGNARNLDWQSSLALLQQNNPELASARENFESTRAQEGVAKSGFLPDISASISSTQSYSDPVGSATQRSESMGLTLSQNLFAGFADLNKYKEAKQNTLIAELQLRQTKAKISSDFKIAYVGLIYAQENVALTQKILNRRKENLSIVQLRFASGRENKGSVLLSEAYYQQATYDSVQAGLQLDVAQNTLAQVLGIQNSEDKLVVVKDVPIMELADMKDFDFKKLATMTLEYQKAVAQSESSRFVFQQSQSHYYPSLNLTGSLGKSDSVFPPENNRWSVGLNLTFPLYSGGASSSNELSAKYRRVSAEINQTTVALQVLVKLKQSFSQFKLAIEKVKVDEKFILATQLRSEISKSKYNNGLMTFENWDIVENDLIQREKSNLSSFRDRIVGQANWEQTQGIGLVP